MTDTYIVVASKIMECSLYNALNFGKDDVPPLFYSI